MNTAIETACQMINTHGFEGLYHCLVERFIHNVPMSYTQFANRTQRATLPLQSQDEALFYSVAYGLSHYNTFLQVLHNNLMIDDAGTVINIIDYGCGQGIATLAMLMYIASQQNPKNIHVNIHLIEPSAVSLGNASYKVLSFVQALGFGANITTQNRPLKEAVVPDFNNQADTLHLMSYILDIETVQEQLPNITRQIKQSSGVHHVIASSISHPNGYQGFDELSHLLLGRKEKFDYYYINHYSYRVIQGHYDNAVSKAIGMVISLDNTNATSRAA
ncbi:hypothetical protein [Moraxella cuniculi]|uniref:Methyltransferase domain n=1 Tax=Moraxella cuniculi TaxID=34061 RepID=A0A3S5EFS6_9GAMM|nr:hypothetical protein [Moraxella cuniculi]VEG12218.1 Uncharacterised protein [Moraxella cuniculi]